MIIPSAPDIGDGKGVVTGYSGRTQARTVVN